MPCHNISAHEIKIILSDANIPNNYLPQQIRNHGQSGSVFLLKGSPNLILKVQPNQERFLNVRRENIALNILEKCNWCSKIIACGEIVDIGHYLIMECLTGIPLMKIWLELNESEQLTVGRKLGLIMKELHEKITFSNCGDFHVSYPSIEAMLIEQFEQASNSISANLSLATQSQQKDIISTIKEASVLIGKCLSGFKTESSFHLIHNDLHFGNILCNPTSKALSGVVDFELVLKAIPLLEMLRLYYCVHWPRRFAYPDVAIREKYRNIKLLSLWKGAKETYPEPFNEMNVKPHLLCASIIYDLNAMRKAIINKWEYSIQDNLRRLNYSITNHKILR